MLPNRSLLPRVALTALALLAVPAASPAGAQVIVADQGTFTITVAGARIGREDYSVRRVLADGSLVTQGNVLRNDVRSTIALTTDSLGTPLRFVSEQVSGGRSVQTVTGEFRRGLWSTRTVTPTGESAREFRLPDVALAAEELAVHHAWLLVRFRSGSPVSVLRPRRMAMGRMVVDSVGADTVYFGLDRYDALRWTVLDGTRRSVLSEVWTDLQGRLLRVRVPSEALEAMRDEPPPETPPPGSAYGRAEPLLTGSGIDAFAVACDPPPQPRGTGGSPIGPDVAVAG